ncbi:MAG: hypothetical protein WCK74_08615 [Gemmatimonadaceae bacterium]|jgi:hypothetical protein
MPREIPRTFARYAAVGTLLAGIAGCRAVPPAFATDPSGARLTADALLSAFEQRMTRVVRAPRYANARTRMARFVAAPSRLVEDTSLWTTLRTTRSGAFRELLIFGTLTNGQYSFTVRPQALPPVRTGDSRHVITLAQLPTPDDWQWTTVVENAVGTMAPARATDVTRAFFASMERPAAAIRADYRSALPRTTAAFARLLLLDSLQTVKQADGSTLVTWQWIIDEDRLKAAGFPALAQYVHSYVGPASYRIRLTDASGAEWLVARAAQSRLSLRVRTHDGELQPLTGAARRMPDTLALHTEGSAKISIFTVGFSNLTGEFVHTRSATERGWAMRWTKEPTWHLPPLTETLLHAPLARPFEGAGVQLRIGFAKGAEGQTLLARTATGVARESAILRWLGSLGFTAMRDYAGRVEEEENRFLADLFTAMRQDLAAGGP